MLNGKKESHPSFGMLSFCRSQGGEKALFGSSIKHSNTITMYLREGTVERSLNSDFYMGDTLIAEVEMSPSQFAEAITSMNMGSGVPVTIKWLRGQGRIEPCPFTSKQEQFENEFQQNIDKANELSNEIIRSVEEIFSKKTTITKADKTQVINNLTKLHQTINSNRSFIYRQFNEQMEKTVTEAKGEIEGFMQNRMFSIANKAIVENSDAISKNLSDMECPISLPDKNSDTKGSD